MLFPFVLVIVGVIGLSTAQEVVVSSHDKQYRLSEKMMSHSKAITYCTARGEQLVKVTSIVEAEFIRTTMNPNSYWLGSQSTATGSTPRVWLDGQPIIWWNFENGQQGNPPPAGSGEDSDENAPTTTVLVRPALVAVENGKWLLIDETKTSSHALCQKTINHDRKCHNDELIDGYRETIKKLTRRVKELTAELKVFNKNRRSTVSTRTRTYYPTNTYYYGSNGYYYYG